MRRNRNRGNHIPGTARGPGYDPNRRTLWTENKDAVLHYLDGGQIEVMLAGKWTPIKLPSRMQFFHLYQARPGGWSPERHTVELPDAELN